MDWIYRQLSGALLGEAGKPGEEDIELINNLPNPPLVPLTARDVYVRRCRLAGDAVDAGHGRFRTEGLPRLLEMVQGAPALVGHRRDTLGVARFFGGALWHDSATGVNYIVPKFYWLRNHSSAEDLRVNIDGGIYSEASLGFLFKKPSCSVCGGDVRLCEHVPGRSYDGAACFFYYDEVLRVTEGSFVFRGAQPGTGFMLSNEAPVMMRALPRFKLNGIWHRGVPEKFILGENQ